jgi:hypothetical protein
MYWVESVRSTQGKNWIAASVMARSSIRLVAQAHNAEGKNLKEEIDELAYNGILLSVMKDWSLEVRIPTSQRPVS